MINGVHQVPGASGCEGRGEGERGSFWAAGSEGKRVRDPLCGGTTGKGGLSMQGSLHIRDRKSFGGAAVHFLPGVRAEAPAG